LITRMIFGEEYRVWSSLTYCYKTVNLNTKFVSSQIHIRLGTYVLKF
jgi:hypothetical protein